MYCNHMKDRCEHATTLSHKDRKRLLSEWNLKDRGRGRNEDEVGNLTTHAVKDRVDEIL